MGSIAMDGLVFVGRGGIKIEMRMGHLFIGTIIEQTAEKTFRLYHIEFLSSCQASVIPIQYQSYSS